MVLRRCLSSYLLHDLPYHLRLALILQGRASILLSIEAKHIDFFFLKTHLRARQEISVGDRSVMGCPIPRAETEAPHTQVRGRRERLTFRVERQNPPQRRMLAIQSGDEL